MILLWYKLLTTNHSIDKHVDWNLESLELKINSQMSLRMIDRTKGMKKKQEVLSEVDKFERSWIPPWYGTPVFILFCSDFTIQLSLVKTTECIMAQQHILLYVYCTGQKKKRFNGISDKLQGITVSN